MPEVPPATTRDSLRLVRARRPPPVGGQERAQPMCKGSYGEGGVGGRSAGEAGAPAHEGVLHPVKPEVLVDDAVLGVAGDARRAHGVREGRTIPDRGFGPHAIEPGFQQTENRFLTLDLFFAVVEGDQRLGGAEPSRRGARHNRDDGYRPVRLCDRGLHGKPIRAGWRRAGGRLLTIGIGIAWQVC